MFFERGSDGLLTFTVTNIRLRSIWGNTAMKRYTVPIITFMRQDRTYRIGQNQFTETLVYDVNLPPVVTAGTYDITGSHSTDNVDFNALRRRGRIHRHKENCKFSPGGCPMPTIIRYGADGYSRDTRCQHPLYRTGRAMTMSDLSVSFNKNPYGIAEAILQPHP
jgi:hypothetical protein